MTTTYYRIAHGWCDENWKDFPSLADALAFYKTVAWQEHGASIYNTDRCDDEGDGLTDEENEQIEIADCVVDRYRRLRNRARDRLVDVGVKLLRAPAWSAEELEAQSALELPRRRAARLVEWCLDVAESRVRDLEKAGL